MRIKTEYRIGVGASTILMILVVLALAALSLLSFNSARSNAALSQRNLAMTLSYYDAAAQAQQKLALMDALLADPTVEATDAAAISSLYAAHALQDVTLSSGLAFSFHLDAGAGRTLNVEGLLSPGSSPRYTVTRHELTSPSAPQEQTLNVYLP